MAKEIKYKFLSCEFEHEVVVEVPLLDEAGNPVVEEIKTPATEEVTIPVLDEMGEPLLDEEGQPIVEVIAHPVYDENGEPVYDITYEPVMTTETQVEVDQVILDKSIICPTQAIYDANYPIAEKEAIPGTIEVSGKFDYPTAPHNILAGEYVTINGVLYKATENIPNGENVIVGQNAVETTVEAQLAELAKGE